MSIKSLIAFLILFPAIAFANEWESNGEIVWGQGECSTQMYTITIDDAALSVAGADQVKMDLCPPPISGLLSNASVFASSTCAASRGTQIQIKDIWYHVIGAIGTSEQCKIGLSVDFAGGEPYDFESWSTIDVGASTTTIANCDEIYNPAADGSIDDIGDTCHVSDPVGTIIEGASGGTQDFGFKFQVDAADTGTPDCASLEALIVKMRVRTCEVPF